MNEQTNSRNVVVDLDYVMPDTVFINPVYSMHGEKLLNEKEILTALKIKLIRERYGNKVFFYLPDKEAGIVSDSLIKRAFNQTKTLIDDILYYEKLSVDSYKKSEELVEEIIEQLNPGELHIVNLLKDMKTYDNYLYYHSLNVGFLSALLLKKRKKYSCNDMKNVVLGAYLSDLGKIKLEKTMLNKPGRLTEEQLTEVKLHPQHGYNIVKTLENINPVVLQTILFHHERFDDEGYYNLPYETLPLPPKVVAICDAYDALTSIRPFRGAYTPADAMKIIFNSSESIFERSIVSDFLNSMCFYLNNSQSFYRKGDFCILNTNEIAIITELSKRDILKPRVMVFAKYSKSGEKVSMNFYNNPIEVDLMIDMNRSLASFVTNKKLISGITLKLMEKRLLTDYLISPE